MKRIIFLSLICSFLLLSLSSCSNPENIIKCEITGWVVYPSTTVQVGEPVNINLQVGISTESGIYMLYHWVISDYDREIITDSNGITGVTFATPGVKKVFVYVTSNHPDLKTNIYSGNITVEAPEQ